MRKIFEVILSVLIFTLASLAGIGSYKNQFHNAEVPKDAPMFEDEIVYIEPEDIKIITEVPLIRTTQYVNLTFEERDLLEQIAYAEARGEGSKGMALVMRVVLNRSLRDGKSVKEVIFAPNQFYTAGMTPNVSDECHEALEMVLDGWDESQGACYFTAGGYSRYGEEKLFVYGNHYFSR